MIRRALMLSVIFLLAGGCLPTDVTEVKSSAAAKGMSDAVCHLGPAWAFAGCLANNTIDDPAWPIS
jgi:hypothetical protein